MDCLSLFWSRVPYAAFVGVKKTPAVTDKNKGPELIVWVVAEFSKPTLSPRDGLGQHFFCVGNGMVGQLLSINLQAASLELFKQQVRERMEDRLQSHFFSN